MNSIGKCYDLLSYSIIISFLPVYISASRPFCVPSRTFVLRAHIGASSNNE
jgi:hypothetical protein